MRAHLRSLPVILPFLLVRASRCWWPPLSLNSAEPISESGSSVSLFSIWQQVMLNGGEVSLRRGEDRYRKLSSQPG